MEWKKREKTKDSQKKSIDINTLKNYFNQKTLIGVSVAGLLVLVCVYALVYLDYTEQTEVLEASNAQLKKELDVLEEYYHNMETYKQDTQTMKTEIEAILQEYPADAREEDIIILAVQLQEENKIAYSNINMEEKEGVYTVAHDLAVASGMEEISSDIIFTQKHATYVTETTYSDLKECIAQIYASPNRIGIDHIVYCKNEERGTLEGNINLYFYSAAGTGREYTAPDISEYQSGTKDLFQAGR